MCACRTTKSLAVCSPNSGTSFHNLSTNRQQCVQDILHIAPSTTTTNKGPRPHCLHPSYICVAAHSATTASTPSPGGSFFAMPQCLVALNRKNGPQTTTYIHYIHNMHPHDDTYIERRSTRELDWKLPFSPRSRHQKLTEFLNWVRDVVIRFRSPALTFIQSVTNTFTIFSLPRRVLLKPSAWNR